MTCLMNKKGKEKNWKSVLKSKLSISADNLIKCKWTFSAVKSLCLFFCHYSNTWFLHWWMLKGEHFIGISVGQSICVIIIAKHTIPINSIRSEWSHYSQENNEGKKEGRKECSYPLISARLFNPVLTYIKPQCNCYGVNCISNYGLGKPARHIQGLKYRWVLKWRHVLYQTLYGGICQQLEFFEENCRFIWTSYNNACVSIKFLSGCFCKLRLEFLIKTKEGESLFKIANGTRNSSGLEKQE